MTDTFRTFKSGEILSSDDRAKLSPADRRTYDLEQKIRGLMKLADDPRTPSEERDNATQAISKLIARYQIDLEILRTQTGGAKQAVKIVQFNIDLSNRYGMGNIRASAIGRSVIYPLGGQIVWWHKTTDSAKDTTMAKIFLPEELVGFAKMLIASFTLQFETSMKVASVQHKRELDSNWRVTANNIPRMLSDFRKSYLLSWGEAVGYRVLRGRRQAEQEATQALGKEIALLDASALTSNAKDEWNKERGSKTRTRNYAIVSETGESAGRKDGRRAQLGINEVGGDRARSLSA